MLTPIASSVAAKVVLSLLAALLLAGIVRRPRVLLAPVVLAFAVLAWIKTVLRFPNLIQEWITAATLERHAAGLAHHAQVAEAFWSANSEFRPIARALFDRVAQGYGLQIESPEAARAGAHPPAPYAIVPDPKRPDDPFGAAQRSAAADAVTASRGKK